MGKTNRLFQRPGRPTWYADLRDLDGGRPSTGTNNKDEATKWLAKKLIALETPRNGVRGSPRTPIESYAEHHLEAKKLNRRPSTVKRDQLSIRTFLEWAGEHTTLEAVDPGLLNKYSRDRQREGAAPQTVLHELHALSSLFKRAVAEGYLAQNPVALMVDKPKVERDEPEWLEPEEAAAFLAECEGDTHTLMAIALLTGARKKEVTGLEWSDVDFGRGLIRIRPNEWRKLKRGQARSIKLWPQLRAMLEPLRQKSGLVVPSERTGRPYTDVRPSIEEAREAAGIEKAITWNTLRHTYASLRLQTLDNGAPISLFKVARELGHSSPTMIFKHYGHVLESPQRLEMVEYRIREEEEEEP